MPYLHAMLPYCKHWPFGLLWWWLWKVRSAMLPSAPTPDPAQIAGNDRNTPWAPGPPHLCTRNLWPTPDTTLLCLWISTPSHQGWGKTQYYASPSISPCNPFKVVPQHTQPSHPTYANPNMPLASSPCPSPDIDPTLPWNPFPKWNWSWPNFLPLVTA